MAVEIEIKTTLDNDDVSKGFAQTEKEVKKVTKSLGSLTAQQEKLRKEFDKADIGTKKFKELQKELVSVTRDIKNVELSIEALDTDQVASEIGGLVGGFADVATGAILAFGVSEESAEEFLKTFAQVEGVGRIAKGSIEGVQAATKLYNSSVKGSAVAVKAAAIGTAILSAAQTAYNFVVGSSTGLLKVFKIALASTGVGLLIVGLGLLISNLKGVGKTIGNVIDFFLAPFAAAIEGVIDVLQFLGVVESDQAAASRKASEKRAKALSEAADAAEESAKRQIEALEEIKEKVVSILDFEIAKRKAAGEATEEIELKKLAFVKRIADEELKITREKFNTLTEIQKKQQESGNLLSIAHSIAITDFKIKQAADELEIQEDAQVKASQSLELFNIKQQKTEEDAAKKASAERKKLNAQRLKDEEAAAAERLKLAEEEADRILQLAISQAKQKADFERTLADLRIGSIKNEFDRERALVNQKFEDDLADLEEKGFLTLEAEILIAEQRNIALADIERERFDAEQAARDAELDAEQTLADQKKAIADEEVQAALDNANKRIATVSFFVNGASALNDAFNTIQKNQLAEGESLTLQQQKRQFNRNKAFNIGQAIINTAQGVTQAIAQFGPPPSPLGIAGIATAGLIGAAQIAAIGSQKFNPGGGSGGGSINTSVPTASVPSQAAPSIPITEIGGGNETSSAQQAGTSQGAPILQAFVNSNEIADEQNVLDTINLQSAL